MAVENILENLGMRQEYTPASPSYGTLHTHLHTHPHQGETFSIASLPTGKSLESPSEETLTDIRRKSKMLRKIKPAQD